MKKLKNGTILGKMLNTTIKSFINNVDLQYKDSVNKNFENAFVKEATNFQSTIDEMLDELRHTAYPKNLVFHKGVATKYVVTYKNIVIDYHSTSLLISISKDFKYNIFEKENI